jgi:membrane-bound serine protease (ClpP class)
VEIEGEIYDAVSSGSFIDKGENIKVIRVEGSRLVVEEVRE